MFSLFKKKLTIENNDKNKETEKNDYPMKILFLGRTDKTSLIIKFTENSDSQDFPNHTNKCYKKNIIIDDKLVKFDIWNSPENEMIIKILAKDSYGFILVFDISSKYTFNYISYYLELLEEIPPLDDGKIACKVLVGNNCDTNER